MAQTIAMQRGTGTLSASGNTSATLFLQSGGSATRVIVNGIAFFTNSGTGNPMYMSLYVDSSGGPGYIVGKYYQYTASGQFTVSPSNGMGTVGSGPGFGDCSTQLYNGSSTTWPAFASPSNVTAAFGGLSSVMQNFWLGPGDSVVLRANNGGLAQTYGYSFTTITES